MSNWLEDMKRDALAIAALDFKLQERDHVVIDCRSCDGEWLSSVTFENPFFAIDVEVWRPTDLELTERGPNGELIFKRLATGENCICAFSRCYLGDDAREFFLTLMILGGETRWD